MSGSTELRISDQQAERLLHATAVLVSRAVRGQTLCSPQLEGMQECLVDGIFVSLYKGRELRACCGIIRGPHLLGPCLERAAWRAACDDPRFMPITRDELPQLHMDLHVLHDWHTCPATPAERPAAISVGRHGLMLRRNPAAGLLLPAVARTHGWNATIFLQQCCLKAGLPSSAWQEVDCQLELFEAQEYGSDLKLFLP
ncbi:MAG: AmmeMemoRadiSam system protein A [Planctomycetota bacterium]